MKDEIFRGFKKERHHHGERYKEKIVLTNEVKKSFDEGGQLLFRDVKS
ncbi:hypothetical protein [Paenibacillus thiaminolyticus]|nr:hypothetical protein [Paenibacillus thiaminolyticus]WII35450.1 hypothetical protein O0V01_17310 [Paenibacillus thiaminolyticus]